MADRLNFGIDMYLDDDSSELKDEKEDSIDRNFYENNAFSSHLHVSIGEALTTDQAKLATDFLLSDFVTEIHLGSSIRYLGQFVVGTQIHETTRGDAFAGEASTLIHVKCANLNGDVFTTSTPICQQAVAKGTPGVDLSGSVAGGEEDAETIAKYAMGRSTTFGSSVTSS
ncbi:hypothetical protein BJ166DRAFT_615097 [Pestalotiopsis sp. NC0098]|nr:hypothetical protein BJ166DRAFT_615097 [Pestalotiopsis sp. NC0098]